MDLETRLRALPESLDGLRAGDDLAATVRARHRKHRRRRLLVATSVAAVLAVVAGGAVAAGTLRTDAAPPATTPSPDPRPVPADPRLLPWPARGPLAGEPQVVAAALRVAGSGSSPSFRIGPPHLLWIGLTGISRDAVAAFDRYALAETYVSGERPGLYLQLLSGTTDDRWHLSGTFPIRSTATALGLAWSLDQICFDERRPCPVKTVRLLVVGAPDLRAVRYRFRGGPAAEAPVSDGVALVTSTVDPADMDVTGSVPVSIEVTPAGAPATTVTALEEARVAVITLPPAVEWQPVRGLPPLLDAPQTFPALDLWGRLHGLPGRGGYGNPVWGGTLADGSTAVVAQPTAGGFGARYHLTFGVTPPAGDTFLVRDLPNPDDPRTVHQVSAFLPLSDGRCELVVVGEPGTTGVARNGADLAVANGVGTAVLPSCDGHDGDRITVRRGGTTTYEGPVDSTRPGGGVKKG